MRGFGRKAVAALCDAAPGALACLLISNGGLLLTVAVLALEAALLFARRICGQGTGRKAHRRIMLLFSSVGIAVGCALYPGISAPESVGIAAAILTIAVHGALFLIASAAIDR